MELITGIKTIDSCFHFFQAGSHSFTHTSNFCVDRQTYSYISLYSTWFAGTGKSSYFFLLLLQSLPPFLYLCPLAILHPPLRRFWTWICHCEYLPVYVRLIIFDFVTYIRNTGTTMNGEYMFNDHL